jgi:hypothetical protein
LKKNRIILASAFIIILASVSIVTADEAGIVTINIFNSPSTQLHTDILNSTIEGQINYTNSQAIENVTLTNSTLTLNVNGQNITVTDQGGNITINSPNQTPTPTPIPTSAPTMNPTPTVTPTPTATPRSLLSVTFIKYGPNHSPVGNGTQYDFDVIVSVPTSFNYPWGKNVTHEKLGQALIPLASKYNLATRNDNGFITAAWQNMVVVDGENIFSLWSSETLTPDQIQSLTSDLYDAFFTAMN